MANLISIANRRMLWAALLAVIAGADAYSAEVAESPAASAADYSDSAAQKFMQNWLVLGPMSYSQGADPPALQRQEEAFAEDYLAEHGGEAGITPTADLAHDSDDGKLRWQQIESKNDVVDLTQPFGAQNHSVGYASATIESPAAKDALLAIGSDDGVKVWLNGTLVHDNPTARAHSKDNDVVPVELREGVNRLLLKVQNITGDWSFSCRVLGQNQANERFVKAAFQGELDLVTLLLTHGAQIDARPKWDVTALHAAQLHGHQDVVDFLTKEGADPDAERPTSEEILAAMFSERLDELSPGFAVLVARDGEVLLKQGYGYASLEHEVPIRPDTKFRIGSVSKQITAAAILLLAEDGKLSIDDPLSKFVPDFPRGDEVTIHHLLTHTSGIKSYTEKADFFESVTVPVEPAEHIESFQNDTYDFSPGEKWKYNNSGYFLLGYIVEKVSGQSFADYLSEHIFQPLGMDDTGIHESTAILKHEATGYSYENGEFKKSLDWDMSRAGGAGAVYSTVEDLYRWNEAVFNGKLLNEESLRAAWTPVELPDEASSNYGYGWVISELRGLKEIQHSGGLHGFLSYLTRFPSANLTVVVLSNASPGPGEINPSALAREIVQACLWQEMQPVETQVVADDIDVTLLADYVGSYDYGGAVLRVTLEGERLFAQMSGQPKFEIFPKSESEFFWKVVDAQVQFVRDDDDEVMRAVHHQSGMKIVAPKLAEQVASKIDPAKIDIYVGKYDYGKSIGKLTVTRDGDRIFAQLSGQPKFEIFPRSDTEFFWKVVNAQVTFVQDDQGQVVKAVHKQGGQTIDAPKVE